MSPREAASEIDPTAKPAQHMARRVPVALKDELREKLRTPEAKKIIKREKEPSRWTNHMVVVKRGKKL